MSRIRKLDDLPLTEIRQWYNNWIESNVTENDKVLDVGKSIHWDYGFPTIDTNPRVSPTYLGDVENIYFEDQEFDIVLCNGLYEYVSNPQKMINEVLRITKKVALFGFVGSNYKPYKRNWKYFCYAEAFPSDFEVLEHNMLKEYHYFICKRKHLQ